MAIKFDTVTGLSHWASYLINGDSSGMAGLIRAGMPDQIFF